MARALLRCAFICGAPSLTPQTTYSGAAPALRRVRLYAVSCQPVYDAEHMGDAASDIAAPPARIVVLSHLFSVNNVWLGRHATRVNNNRAISLTSCGMALARADGMVERL